MTKLKFDNHSAFTIVELLIVIVVIGIIATVSFVAYIGVTQKAVLASIQSDLSNAQKQLELFQVDNSAFPNSITDCPTPSSDNLCIKTSSGNVISSYSVNNSSNPQTYSIIETNGDNVYSISNDTSPAQLAAAPFSPVADWLAISQGEHYGNYFDLVSRTWASVTRSTPKTIYDPSTNKMYDVPANKLSINPRSDGKSGGEAIIESVRTNSLLQSTFSDQSALDTWNAEPGLTASLGGASLYSAAKEVSLSADTSDRSLWQSIASTAVTRAVSVYVRKVDNSAVTSSDMQFGALAGAITPASGLIATTFTQLGSSSAYRATATYTGTAATWAIGVVVKANSTVIISCPQEEIGAYSSSYIPTTSSIATRNWDVVTVPTGNWSQSQGTALSVSDTSIDAAGQSTRFYWSDASSTNYIWMYSNSSASAIGYIRIGGVNYLRTRALPVEHHVQSIIWSSSYMNTYINNNIITANIDMPSSPSGLPSVAYIGTRLGTYGPFNGPIQRILVYSTVLSAADITSTYNTIKDGPQ